MDAIRALITVGVAAVVLLNQALLPTSEQIASADFSPIANSGFLLGTLYLSALLLGMAEVLRDNGAQTLMPTVVDKSQLEKANGRLWGAEMVMNSFVGPPLGGLLLAVAFSLPFSSTPPPLPFRRRWSPHSPVRFEPAARSKRRLSSS